MITIRNEKFQKEIASGKLLILHRRHISNALMNHGAENVNDLQKVITTGSRSGRVYSYRGGKHQASAPGEPPASRSGKMAKSFIYKATGANQLLIANTARSKKGFPYPGYLEPGFFATDLNRPYFLVTISKNQANLQRDLGGFI